MIWGRFVVCSTPKRTLCCWDWVRTIQEVAYTLSLGGRLNENEAAWLSHEVEEIFIRNVTTSKTSLAL